MRMFLLTGEGLETLRILLWKHHKRAKGQGNDIHVARISLKPSKRILFSERSLGTSVSGVEAPISGANDSASFPTGAEFLEQVKQLIRIEIGGSSASLQYRNSFPDNVANSEWPRGYKTIKFTSFSGEGSEDDATHISRFQGECGPYGNDENLKLHAFVISYFQAQK